MRRIIPIGIIAVVGVAFVVAVVTGAQGPLFLPSLLAVAGLLVVLVFAVVFGGQRASPRRAQRGHSFANEETSFRKTLEGFTGSLSELDPEYGIRADLETEGSERSARAFVRTLVPVPPAPVSLSVPSARHASLDALREEGRGLIRLAKIMGLDVEPYGALLSDTRVAAMRGDAETTLRSLQLANELLRARVEKFIVKRHRAAAAPREPWNL